MEPSLADVGAGETLIGHTLTSKKKKKGPSAGNSESLLGGVTAGSIYSGAAAVWMSI